MLSFERVLVQPKGETLTGIVHTAPGCQIVVDAETMLRTSILHSLADLTGEERFIHWMRMRGVPPGEADQTRDAVEENIRRTVRMLLRWLALMFPDSEPPTPALARLWQETREAREQIPALIEAINTVRGALAPTDGLSLVWLPLIITLAIATSQAEHWRPVLWEAWSAERTVGVLRASGWPAKAANLVKMLIRYQSGPGQWARQTGDDKFLAQIELPGGLFTPEQVKAALWLVACAQEARNRALPVNPGDDIKIGYVNVNAGGYRAWDSGDLLVLPEPIAIQIKGPRVWRDPERLRNALVRSNVPTPGAVLAASTLTPIGRTALLFAPPAARHQLWGYSGHLAVDEAEMEGFRCLCEQQYQFPTPEAFSLNPHQAWYLAEKLCDAIHHVALGASPLRDLFQFRRHRVPGPADVVEVLLHDQVVALARLFPGLTATAGERLQGPTAGDLVRFLLGEAEPAMRLHETGRALRPDGAGEAAWYVPWPLMDRIVRIAGDLRGDSCVRVPVVYEGTDGAERHSILLPKVEDVAKGEVDGGNIPRITTWLARYVWFVVLNRAMTTGYTKVEVGVGHEWGDLLTEQYEKDGFQGLVQKCVDDYNHPVDTLHLRVQVAPAEIASPRLDDLPGLLQGVTTRLATGCAGEGDLAGATCLVLGLDIGGTFVKGQYWILTGGTAPRLIPLGSRFRTAFKIPGTPKNTKEATEFFARHLFRRASRWFKSALDAECDRLSKCGMESDSVTAIRSHVASLPFPCIGVSWPGPVKGNRIAGISRPLRAFGPPFTGTIGADHIEDVLKIDLAGELQKLPWAGMPALAAGIGVVRILNCEKIANTLVFMCNDGDAEALGALGSPVVGGAPLPEALRLLVIKLGTGTAGAAIIDGRLLPAWCEWGKLSLDLGAVTDHFPLGANAYASAGTPPRLATNGGKPHGMFTLKNLTSLEVGLVLALGAKVVPGADAFRRLQEECARIELATEFPDGCGLDAEDLRHFFGGGPHDEELCLRVQAELLGIGIRAIQGDITPLCDWGTRRLGALLGLKVKDVERLLNQPSLADPAWGYVAQAQEIAQRAACTLGCFVGDLAVGLASIFSDERIDTILLSGGVLSGDTGEIAREAALEHARLYDPHWSRVGSVLTRGNGQPPAPLPGDLYSGTLGAALAGVIGFLKVQQAGGLDLVALLGMALGPNDQLVIKPTEVRVVRETVPHGEAIDLTQYALSQADVEKALDEVGFSLNLHRVFGPDPHPTYAPFEI